VWSKALKAGAVRKDALEAGRSDTLGCRAEPGPRCRERRGNDRRAKGVGDGVRLHEREKL